jgi:hypothetical protein
MGSKEQDEPEEQADEWVISHTMADSPMPIIGARVVALGHLYRCVSIEFADSEETRTGRTELRVRFREESGSK